MGDSFLEIKRTGYKIFTGLPQGTIKVLKDPEPQHPKEAAAPNTASSESFSEGEGDGTPTPSDDQREAVDAKEETPSIKLSTADQGTPSKGTWSDKKEKAKEGGWRQTPHSLVNKE
jgi:hypothetical protein